MEKAKKKLKYEYDEAKNAYEAKNYSMFFVHLRISMEWLAKVLIYQFAGQTEGSDLLSGKIKEKNGIIINKGDFGLRQGQLIWAIASTLQAYDCYKDIEGDQQSVKLTIEGQVRALKVTYNFCGQFHHAGVIFNNPKLQASQNTSILPAFIDILYTYGLLKPEIYDSLKSILIPISELHIDVKDLQDQLQSKNDELEKAKSQVYHHEEVINNQISKLSAIDQKIEEAERQASEEKRVAQEEKMVAEAEINRLNQLIQDLQQLNKNATVVSSMSQSSISTFKIKNVALDDDQLEVIEKNLSESMLVAGCAGSGKSIIALSKAQQIIESGASVILIAYTKSLSSFMDVGWDDNTLKNCCMYHYQWKEQHMPSADYIIVDEIQDFTESEIREFMNAAKKCYFFFGDTAQSIYNNLKDGKTMTIEDIAIMTDLTQLVLYNNYRLPRPIAKITQGYVGVDVKPYSEKIYQSKEMSLPHIIGYSSETEQLHALVNLLKSQTLDNIAILLSDNLKVIKVYAHLLEAGIAVESKYSFGAKYHDSLDFSSPLPKIMTYHSAKGLQFNTVIIPFCESVDGLKKKPLYVAMTRTLKNLYVMYQGENPPKPLDEVPEHLYLDK